MRSRTWTTLCVLLAIACGGGGHEPPTDNAPDRPFPFLGDGSDDDTAMLDDRDGGPRPDGDMELPEDGGVVMGHAGSTEPEAGSSGTAGSMGGTGGNAGSEAGGGAGSAGEGPDAGPGDAGVMFVPNADALVGSWAAEYKLVPCPDEVTEELMDGCDTPSMCSPTTLNIDENLNVTGTDLISMALGSSWSDDTLTQTQKDNFGTDSELTLWFLDEDHILGREWSAGSTFTGGFEICRGIRATRNP